MLTYYCKLLPPRATFLRDMSVAEGKLMQEHASYWRGWMARGKVVVFGMVADSATPFGVGVVEVGDEAEVRALITGDPAIRANLGFRYEVHPMPLGAVHPGRGAA